MPTPNIWTYIDEDSGLPAVPSNNSFLRVHLLQNTDAVAGNNAVPGTSGVANRPLEELYINQIVLRNQIGNQRTKLLNVLTINNDATLPDLTASYSNYNRLYELKNNAGPVTITLPNHPVNGNGDIGEFEFAYFANHSAYPLRIQVYDPDPNAGDHKIFGGPSWCSDFITGVRYLILHPGENLTLVMPGDSSVIQYYVVVKPEAWDRVGEYYHALSANNALECNGQIVSRAEYPRLWAWVLQNNWYVIESAWGNNIGFFSNGDGSSTFRIPNLQGLFVRNQNGGTSGIDANRPFNSYQDDAIAAHDHSYLKTNVPITSGFQSTGAGGNVTAGPVLSNQQTQTATATSDTGTTETRPKNISLPMWVRY